MKILFFEWGSYTYEDILENFDKRGIDYKVISYCFKNKCEDEYFEYRFRQYLDDSYDAVFSVNYFPLVAKCCYEKNIRYLFWVYDVQSYTKYLELPTNRGFFFDRVQVGEYRREGFENVYHLPLAVNTGRLGRISLPKEEWKEYGAEISFVGNLYKTNFAEMKAVLSDYYRGVIDGWSEAQQQLYGCFILDELVSDEFCRKMMEDIRVRFPAYAFDIGATALKSDISYDVTYNERLLLLNLLSAYFQVDLYSYEVPKLLPKVNFKGTCDYRTVMPKVFTASKINLNVTLKSIKSGIPLRAMDILGCGGFLMSNFQTELADYFEDGTEVVMYESVEDAYEKCKYYLEHEKERKAIAISGYRKVSEEFSYDRQLTRLFETAMD